MNRRRFLQSSLAAVAVVACPSLVKAAEPSFTMEYRGREVSADNYPPVTTSKWECTHANGMYQDPEVDRCFVMRRGLPWIRVPNKDIVELGYRAAADKALRDHK